jgi:hypothetical protein
VSGSERRARSSLRNRNNRLDSHRPEGLYGTFTIVHVDAIQSIADLELTNGTHKIQERTPFNAIHPLGEDVSHGARIVREVAGD